MDTNSSVRRAKSTLRCSCGPVDSWLPDLRFLSESASACSLRCVFVKLLIFEKSKMWLILLKVSHDRTSWPALLTCPEAFVQQRRN